MFSRSCEKKALWLLSVSAAALACSPALAQTAAPPPDTLEEVVVTGIRQSMQQSIQHKKNSTVIVDAITAEDIGKLPDQNVVETLQRVTGVQVSRVGGEGNDFTIRGISQNQIEFNGTSMTGPSGDGSARLREFNPEILAGLEVVKSPSADRTEGSLGGTVNLITKKPLDMKSLVASGSVQGMYLDQADKLGYNVSGMVSGKMLDDRLGVLLGATHYDYTRNGNSFNTDGWTLTSGMDTNNDGKVTAADEKEVYRPLRMVANMLYADQWRDGYNAAIQYRPLDDLEFNFDAALTRSEIELTTQRLQTLLTDAATDVVIGEGGTVVSATYTNPTMRPSIYQEITTNNQAVYALSGKYKPGRWVLEGRLSYSDGDREEFIGVPLVGPKPGLTTTVTTDFGAGTDVPTYRLNQNYDPLDASNYQLLSNFETIDFTENKSHEAKFDIGYDAGWGWIDRVKTGARYEKRKLDIYRRAQNPTAAELLKSNPSLDKNGDGLIGAEELSGFSYTGLPANGYLDGASGDIVRNWLGGSVDFATERAGLGLDYPPVTLTSVRRTEQEQKAIYLMTDLDADIGGFNILGNAGVRQVWIDRTAGGYVVGTEAVYQDYPAKFTYTLPSLNLRSEVADDVMLRFSAAKVIANPALGSVAPGTTPNVVRMTASRGNPNLKPYEATQYDLTAEWYFAPASLLSAAVFYKDVASFTVNTTTKEYIENGAASGIYDITQPSNGESGKVQGVEFGYQQVFGGLTGILEGSGVAFSYTFADSETPLTDPLTGKSEPLPVLSRHSYNASVFIEQDWGNARLTYSWRDGFLETVQTKSAGGNLYARAYGQFDASFQYNLSEQYKLSLELVNITKEPIETYVGHTSRTRLYEVNDRRIFLGVSATL